MLGNGLFFGFIGKLFRQFLRQLFAFLGGDEGIRNGGDFLRCGLQFRHPFDEDLDEVDAVIGRDAGGPLSGDAFDFILGLFQAQIGQTPQHLDEGNLVAVGGSIHDGKQDGHGPDFVVASRGVGRNLSVAEERGRRITIIAGVEFHLISFYLSFTRIWYIIQWAMSSNNFQSLCVTMTLRGMV